MLVEKNIVKKALKILGMKIRFYSILYSGIFLFLCSSCHFSKCQVEDKSPDGRGFFYAVVGNEDEFAGAIQRAGETGHGTILLKPGIYRLKEPVFLKDKYHVVITGSGWNTILEKTTDGNALVFENCHFCWVKDLLIDYKGKGESGSGIVFKDASSCVVSQCRISSFPQSGIALLGNPASPMSSNTVRDCHFIGNRDIQLKSFCNNDFYILGNQFGTHGWPYKERPAVACALDHSSAGTYTMNFHWGNVVALQLGPGANFNRIENNRFEESSQNGIRIGSPDGGDTCVENIITGNTIHTNSEFNIGAYNAVEAWNAIDVIFTQNQVFSWNSEETKHKNSLYLGEGCSNWIITDNIFRHHTEKAILKGGSGEHIIERNLAD